MTSPAADLARIEGMVREYGSTCCAVGYDRGAGALDDGTKTDAALAALMAAVASLAGRAERAEAGLDEALAAEVERRIVAERRAEAASPDRESARSLAFRNGTDFARAATLEYPPPTTTIVDTGTGQAVTVERPQRVLPAFVAAPPGPPG